MRHVRIIIVAFVAVFVSGNLCAAAEDTIEKGKKVFANYCDVCHGTSINNRGATNILQEKYQGGIPAALEERTDLEPKMIKDLVRGQVPGMVPFRPTEITDADLEALAAYLMRNNKKK